MRVDRSSLFLREHQQANLDYFRGTARALSTLPYGAGKTAVAIKRIGDLVPPRRALVVTTNGTLYKWVKDLRTWGAPDWVIVTLVGSAARRVARFERHHNIAVTNYEGLRVLLSNLGLRFLRKYKVVIFDEIHRLKNPTSDISLDAALVGHPSHADFVYGLTGSPVLEGPADSFGVLRAVDPSIFGTDYEAFLKRFFIFEPGEKPDGSKTYPKWRCKPGAFEYIRERLREVSFRRERDQIEGTFPAQDFRQPVYGVLRRGTRARAMYFEAENRLRLALRTGIVPVVQIRARLEKLCQLARGWVYDGTGRAAVFDCQPGVVAFEEYLESINRERVVVWAVCHPDMEQVAHVLERMGLKHRMVLGKVRSTRRRQAALNAFNDGRVDALIAHPLCIGEGVDLSCTHSFRYSYRWSVQQWEQIFGRFARMSSRHDYVDYTDLVVRGTIDEGIVEAVKAKVSVADAIRKTKDLPWRVPGPAEEAQHALQR